MTSPAAGVLGAVQPHVVNREPIVEAAPPGGRRLALQALLGDPLVRDFRVAPKLLDELLAAHASSLPQFRSARIGTRGTRLADESPGVVQ